MLDVEVHSVVARRPRPPPNPTSADPRLSALASGNTVQLLCRSTCPGCPRQLVVLAHPAGQFSLRRREDYRPRSPRPPRLACAPTQVRVRNHGNVHAIDWGWRGPERSEDELHREVRTISPRRAVVQIPPSSTAQPISLGASDTEYAFLQGFTACCCKAC